MGTQYKTDLDIEEEDSLDAVDFMKANGEEFFIINENPDIGDGKPLEIDSKNSISIGQADRDSDRDMHNPDKVMHTEENRAYNRCTTICCGGTTSGADKYCYYCQKKQRGLIENDPEDLTFLK